MNVDDDAIDNFMGVTGVDRNTAKFFLEACGSNFEAALAMFHGTFGTGGRTHGPGSCIA